MKPIAPEIGTARAVAELSASISPSELTDFKMTDFMFFVVLRTVRDCIAFPVPLR